MIAASHDNETVEQLKAEIKRLQALVFVPGMLKCAKCGFVMISANLNMLDGTITARETTEHCPNDGAPMWRVTERESCNEQVDRGVEQMERAKKAEAEVAKLQADVRTAEKRVRADAVVLIEGIIPIDELHHIGPGWGHYKQALRDAVRTVRMAPLPSERIEQRERGPL